MLRFPVVTLFDELRGVLAAFDRDGIDYALVGGLAVAIWGAPRATKDIDLLIQPRDRDRAMQAAAGLGFTLAALPMEFKDGTTMQRVTKIDSNADAMTLDLMLVDRSLAAAWQSRARLPFGDASVSVVSREALIGMKARAARPIDLVDVQNLQEVDR